MPSNDPPRVHPTLLKIVLVHQVGTSEQQNHQQSADQIVEGKIVDAAVGVAEE